MSLEQRLPLEGVKVVELGTLIAGPFCARLLAEFGAEVIKIEPPGVGDPLRKWRALYKGTSLWWRVQARNKKSVTLDLKRAEAQEIAPTCVSQHAARQIPAAAHDLPQVAEDVRDLGPCAGSFSP